MTLWVYGDGQRETLALTTDAGETNAAVIDFTGWQQLTFTLPDKAASITGFALRLPSALSGTLYLDQLVAAREGMSDTAAPEISVSLSEDGTAPTGKVFDAVDGGSLATLRVTLDGKALSFTYDHQTGALHAALPAADGKAHRIAVIAGDASGSLARTGLSITPVGAVRRLPRYGRSLGQRRRELPEGERRHHWRRSWELQSRQPHHPSGICCAALPLARARAGYLLR